MAALDIHMRFGRNISGLDHLHQSVRDILLTPIGSRVMRRDYGSAIPALLDQNITELTLAQIYAAAAAALQKWEPRLRVTRIIGHALADDLQQGGVSLDIEADYLPNGQPVTLEGVIV